MTPIETLKCQLTPQLYGSGRRFCFQWRADEWRPAAYAPLWLPPARMEEEAFGGGGGALTWGVRAVPGAPAGKEFTHTALLCC